MVGGPYHSLWSTIQHSEQAAVRLSFKFTIDNLEFFADIYSIYAYIQTNSLAPHVLHDYLPHANAFSNLPLDTMQQCLSK